MKKIKIFLVILFVFLLLILANVVYYFYSERQNAIVNANAASHIVPLTFRDYENQTLGFKLRIPTTWTVQESENKVELNPKDAGNYIFFSAALRPDVKNLDDIKNRLDPSVTLTPIQIDTASGIKYSDDNGYQNNWVERNGKVYLFRIYFSTTKGDYGADQILATVKFLN